MKKLFTLLVMVSAVAFTGCSSDDGKSKEEESTMTARIDGIDYTFNTFNVEQFPYPEEGYTDVEVTASIDDNPARTITIIFTKLSVGSDASWYFSYFENDTAFPKMPGFATIVSESTETRIVGTFSGQVESIGNPEIEVKTITNGTFDIHY